MSPLNRLPRLCFTLLILTTTAATISAQTSRPAAIPVQTYPRQSPTFEVVSIRQTGKDVVAGYKRTEDGIIATRQSLTSLILLAYLPMAMWTSDRVKNQPDWSSRDTFDITAKVAPEDLAAWRGREGLNLQQAMLRAVLADRFQLRVHTEPIDVKGFALVKFRDSPALKPAVQGESLPDVMKLSQGGVAQSKRTPEGIVWSFYGTPMRSLADYLTLGSHTIVEDATGLPGNFNFILRHIDTPPGNQGGISDPSDRWDLSPLGLKTMVKNVRSIKVIVDHAERPSAN